MMIDGQVMSTVDNTGLALNIHDAGGTRTFDIGYSAYADTASTDLYEFRIFKGATITPQTVRKYMFKPASAHPNVANLKLDLKFTEGTGATAHDTSGNAHDGTITGGSWVARGALGAPLGTYTDNAAAKAAGLTVGDFYKKTATPDTVSIVVP